MSSVEELKAKGNAAFSAGKFEEAVEHFTAAITIDPSNHVLYSNRSGAYASLQKYNEALQDAEKTIQLKPDWSKGYSRKGTALHFLRKYNEARRAYLEGLRIDPNNAQLKQGLEEVQKEINAQNPGGNNPMEIFKQIFSGDIFGKLQSHPKTAPYLSDPVFITKINEIKNDPSKLNLHIQDPRIVEALGVLASPPGATHGATPDVNMEDAPEEHKHEESEHQETKREETKKEEPKKEETKQEESSPEKKKAEEAKSKGNEAYKKKDFETALKFYDEALAIDPENIIYYTNKAAVYFEMAKYDECRAQCHLALEKSKFSDYNLKAKAWSRIGNAYLKEKKYDEAINAFNKSLTECRTPEVLSQLQKVEKLKEETERLAYIDPQKSIEAKERGNTHFKNGEFPEAIKEYSEAIKRNPKDHVLYSNRAAAYTKLGEFSLGLKDCDEAIKLKPDFAKAWSRKGTLYFFLKEYQKALEAYDEGLKHDPNNTELEEGVKRTLEAIERRDLAAQSGDKEAQEEVLRDPEVQQILQDPIMMQIVNDMAKDPRAAQSHLQNPQIARKIRKLIAAGVIKVK